MHTCVCVCFSVPLARHAYEAALRLSPRSFVAVSSLAKLLFTIGDDAALVSISARAVALGVDVAR